MLEKWPSKGQELLKYIHMVRLAASRVSGVGWSVYDEHYRLHKVRFPHCMARVCFHSTEGYVSSR
jgi:hypothetical protein